MNDTLKQLVRSCPSLPSLPSAAVEVLDLAQQPQVDLKQIARVITRDPALTGRILKTVNSSFYGRSHSVSTINHALVILGIQSVKTLVLGFSLVGSLKQDRVNGFDRDKYWRRSIYAATSARVIAQRCGVFQSEEVFLATLLADIGQLVLDRVMTAQYAKVHARIKSHHDLAAIEQTELGTTHAAVGALVAEIWKLPPLLSAPIAYHHKPASVPEQTIKPIVDVVHTASLCADVFCDEPAAPAIHRARMGLQEFFMLDADASDAILSEITTQTREVANLFEVSLGSAGNDFAAILKRATDALVELSLQGFAQVKVLEQQNLQLIKKVSTDALTGLASRAAFDEALEGGFAFARDHSKPLSLILLDVDHLKSVNETHGSDVGDGVLKYISQILKGLCRPGDTAARFDGETLALILPQTSKSVAAAIAETVRRAFAVKPVPCGFTSIPVTASCGLATFEHSTSHQANFKDKSYLIKAADLALHNAKQSGRNCVKIFSAPATKAA